MPSKQAWKKLALGEACSWKGKLLEWSLDLCLLWIWQAFKSFSVDELILCANDPQAKWAWCCGTSEYRSAVKIAEEKLSLQKLNRLSSSSPTIVSQNVFPLGNGTLLRPKKKQKKIKMQLTCCCLIVSPPPPPPPLFSANPPLLAWWFFTRVPKTLPFFTVFSLLLCAVFLLRVLQ